MPDQLYLCASGRSYLVAQEVFDEIVSLKQQVAQPRPDNPAVVAAAVAIEAAGGVAAVASAKTPAAKGG
jgi:hypothetical protein